MGIRDPYTPGVRPLSPAGVKPLGPVNVALSTPRPAFPPAPRPAARQQTGLFPAPPTGLVSQPGEWLEGEGPRARGALCLEPPWPWAPYYLIFVCCVCRKEICSDFGAQTEEAEVVKGETIRFRSTIKGPEPLVSPPPSLRDWKLSGLQPQGNPRTWSGNSAHGGGNQRISLPGGWRQATFQLGGAATSPAELHRSQ